MCSKSKNLFSLLCCARDGFTMRYLSILTYPWRHARFDLDSGSKLDLRADDTPTSQSTCATARSG
jgi:hypothetical protein